MEFQRIRTLWGVEPGKDMREWDNLFPKLVKLGYVGIEIDIANLKPPELPVLRALCDKHALAIVALIFSSWPQYIGPRPKGLTPGDHLKFYREQIQLASLLKPLKINAQSGSDVFTPEQSIEFYNGTFAVDDDLGFTGRVCHETHRNRSMYNPQVAGYILERVPSLRITADISHWVVVSERILDTSEEDCELLEKILPHVEHIHARIGTTQASQCPEPLDPAFADEREFFERTWLRIIQWRLKNNDLRPITFVPEYGPFPYHPINSRQTYWELANSEAKRLHEMFSVLVASSQP